MDWYVAILSVALALASFMSGAFLATERMKRWKEESEVLRVLVTIRCLRCGDLLDYSANYSDEVPAIEVVPHICAVGGTP